MSTSGNRFVASTARPSPVGEVQGERFEIWLVGTAFRMAARASVTRLSPAAVDDDATTFGGEGFSDGETDASR